MRLGGVTAVGGGISGLGRAPQKVEGGGDAAALLSEIAQDIRAMRNISVVPSYLKVLRGTLTATTTPATAQIQHNTNGSPVNRLLFQCISGSFDVVIGDDPNSGTVFTLSSGFPPFTLPWPDQQISIWLVNRSATTPAQFGLVVMESVS